MLAKQQSVGISREADGTRGSTSSRATTQLEKEKRGI
jgi:hypothetical protein